MNNLAIAYPSAGKFDQALPLAEETLKLEKAKLGPDNPHTLGSMDNLAIAYAGAGKLDQALPLPRDRQTHEGQVGTGRPLDAERDVRSRANLHHALARYDLALAALRGDAETLARSASVRTIPTHRTRCATWRNLSRPLASPTGSATLRTNDETPENRSCDRMIRGPFGAMNNLASVYRESGKLDAGSASLRGDGETPKARLGPDDPDTVVMNGLADVRARGGNLRSRCRLVRPRQPD